MADPCICRALDAIHAAAPSRQWTLQQMALAAGKSRSRFTRTFLAAMGVFTFLTIPLGHPFWMFEAARRSEELHIALEHVNVIGGLVMAAIVSVRR